MVRKKFDWEKEVDKLINVKMIEDYGNVDAIFESLTHEPFVSGLSLDDLRNAATFISLYTGYHDFYEKYECGRFYSDAKTAKKFLNICFNKRLSANMRNMYNYFYGRNVREGIGGNATFALYSLSLHKPCAEMSCLKAAVRFQVLQDENPKMLTSIKNADTILKYLEIPHYEFGYIKDMYRYDYNESEENFVLANKMFGEEFKAQNDFMEAIYNGDIHKAYSIMPSNDKIDNKIF